MKQLKSAVNASLICLALFFTTHLSHAQEGHIGIGTPTPDPSAVLEVKSDSMGILIPRLTAAARDAIVAPATGLMVFVNDDSTFYFYAGSSWVPVGNTSRVLADADGDTKIQVEESDDEDIMRIDLGGTEYFVLDSGRINVKNTGSSVFIGEDAGANDDLSDNNNVAVGDSALSANTSGFNNVAVGRSALEDNTIGLWNVALGTYALQDNKTGGSNIGVGYKALKANKTGNSNIAVGFQALESNTDGRNNLAMGVYSLRPNTSGNENTALGSYAATSNKTGNDNVAVGYGALWGNRTGNRNVGLGRLALFRNFTGSDNVAVGFESGYNIKGDSSVFIGYKAGYNEVGGNRLYIENSPANSANALIYGEFDNDILRFNGSVGIDANPAVKFQVGESGDGSVAESNNWMTFSDRRYKENIRNITGATALISKISGVRFDWKESGQSDLGFIAQDIESVLPALVHTDDNGYKSVDYARVSAVLVEAVKEQQAIIEELRENNEELRMKNEELANQTLEFDNKLKSIDDRLNALNSTKTTSEE